jgi:TonB family protein
MRKVICGTKGSRAWFKLLFVMSALLFFVCAASAQSNIRTNPNDSESGAQILDQPLKITTRPRPEGPFFDVCSKVANNATPIVVRLKVTFPASGKITEIDMVKPSGCGHFDKQAVKAAKKIKFKPAVKNGEPVSVIKLIEYALTSYNY